MTDPTNLDDPNHAFHEMAPGFALMRQRRQQHDARQQMLAQMLQAPPPAGLPTGGMAPLPGQTLTGGGAGAGMTGMAGGMGGLAGLAQAAGGQPIYSQKFGYGPDSGSNWWASNGGVKSVQPEALPPSSTPLGGMAKG